MPDYLSEKDPSGFNQEGEQGYANGGPAVMVIVVSIVIFFVGIAGAL